MYGFCSSNALYWAKLSFTMFIFIYFDSFWYLILLLFQVKSQSGVFIFKRQKITCFFVKNTCIKVFFIKKHVFFCLLKMKKWLWNEFIFLFIGYFIGAILYRGRGIVNRRGGGSHSNLLYTMRASAISWSLLA